MSRLRLLFLSALVLTSVTATSANAGFSLGTGVTYLRYKEDPGAVNISELAWTIKFSSRHTLGTPALELHTNAFANAVPYQLSGMKDPPARFYGANVRVAVGPDLGKAMSIKLSLGGYLWGMAVPNEAYGLRYLAAPQALLSIENSSKQKRRAWVLYAKYAPIRQRTSYELAAGFAIQLNKSTSGKTRAVMLTTDFSKTRVSSFSFHGQDNGMQLYSGSLGISFSLTTESSKRSRLD